MNFFQQQTGFSLIEVLMSLFVLSIILCGLIQMQLFCINESSKSYLKTIAIIQANNLIELFRIQKNTHSNSVNVVQQWQQDTQNLLPYSQNRYNCIVSKCQITIEWQFKKKQKINLIKKI